MRIGINALYLLPGKIGGSETYIRNLALELSKDAGNEYFIFINRESAGIFEKIAPGLKVVNCPINAERRPVRILWEQFILPFQMMRRRIDVILSTGMTAPFVRSGPSYLVLFDLQHVTQPQNFPRWYRLFLKTIIFLSAKTSTGIITISKKSKDEIVRLYKILPESITVTYLACDKKAFRKCGKADVGRIREKYGLPGRFILYAASSLPHKNYSRLLEAFKQAREGAPGVKLVLTGARDYGMRVIEEKIAELGLGPDVVFLGWLPFEDLPAVYNAADVFVFPSLHEGFGLPVVEAFSCGVPVVCSNIETLAEVAGGAALLVDPYDPDDMAKGMLSVIGDPALRKRLIEAGLRRAQDFSWEKTARETIEALTGRAL